IYAAFLTFVAFVTANLLVAAGAESVFAIFRGSVSREQNHAHAGVHPDITERLDHLVNGFGAKGVAHFRAIEGDPRHTIGFVISDVRVLLYFNPVNHELSLFTLWASRPYKTLLATVVFRRSTTRLTI